MSATLGVSPSPSGHRPFSSFRHAIRNFLERLGFAVPQPVHSIRSRKHMLHSSHARGIFPALPRDYIRRRRVVRRISNVIIVVLLSAALAYAIVHVSGPAPFSVPHH